MLHSSVYQQNLVAFIVDEAHPMYENVVCFTAYNEVLLFSECSSNDEFEDDKWHGEDMHSGSPHQAFEHNQKCL